MELIPATGDVDNAVTRINLDQRSQKIIHSESKWLEWRSQIHKEHYMTTFFGVQRRKMLELFTGRGKH